MTHLTEYVRRSAAVDDQRIAELVDPVVQERLLERIVSTPVPVADARRGWPAYRKVAVAAAVLALGVVGVQSIPRHAPEPQLAPVVVPSPTRSEDTGTTASCPFGADRAHLLAHTTFAFDGTVVAIRPDPSPKFRRGHLVTFDVHRWYRGPGGDRMTVMMWSPDANSYMSVVDESYGVGSRMLVSGQPWRATRNAPPGEPIAWACGFTRPYDAGTAAKWADIFG